MTVLKPTLQVHPRFITLEGGEGAGKSTVLPALCAALQANGAEVVCTREPGGTPLAEQIRSWMLDLHHQPPAPITELLLMFAARAQHVHEKLLPALQRGAWVVSDRFTDASYAYQGAGRLGDMDFIAELEHYAVGITPALTLLLDVPVDIGLQRARSRGPADRIESERADFFARIRNAYLARAAAEPRRFRVIDACQSLETVAAQVLSQVRKYVATVT